MTDDIPTDCADQKFSSRELSDSSRKTRIAIYAALTLYLAYALFNGIPSLWRESIVVDARIIQRQPLHNRGGDVRGYSFKVEYVVPDVDEKQVCRIEPAEAVYFNEMNSETIKLRVDPAIPWHPHFLDENLLLKNSIGVAFSSVVIVLLLRAIFRHASRLRNGCGASVQPENESGA